ncbi:Polyamine transporter 3 [Pleurostoma richardsiae]|uniref:Polyamine transporter 3 n=1 Tax=Pleurostoma richardsiae TaxID=41990 RepID=A0AA38VCV7_9PEZI|nr:Polyamine transporter 3 [Pleurostoma richardsiae]
MTETQMRSSIELRRHDSHTAGGLQRIISALGAPDASPGHGQEGTDKSTRVDVQQSSRSSSFDDRVIVAWEEKDPEDPYNWSSAKKNFILVTSMLVVLNSTIASSLPSNAVPYISQEWGPLSHAQRVLPISIFLLGYIVGPIIWAPLSEQYGRRVLNMGTFILFTIFTMACSVAPSWPALLIFRLFVGIFASSAVSIVTGIFADIYADHRTRGRAMALFIAGTVWGPLLAPIISGYCSPINWRWSFRVGLIYAAATMVLMAFIPETYAPILLSRRAQRLRKADPESRAAARHELDKPAAAQLITRVLARPIRMVLTELIVAASCAYLALVYAIFYMTFQAFPLVYEGVYGLSPGQCGLAFLVIGAGATLSLPVFWAYDGYLERARGRGASWARQEECRRVPLACLGGPLFALSLFWIGWTAREGVHVAVPMLAGVPFGMGFMLIFIALLNYLTDAYEVYAASANAAASCCRSLLAAALPFASSPMFDRLGIAGACSLLGGLSCIMCAIPFVFLWKGEAIRAGSEFCVALKMRKEEEERRKRGGVEMREVEEAV